MMKKQKTDRYLINLQGRLFLSLLCYLLLQNLSFAIEKYEPSEREKSPQADDCRRPERWSKKHSNNNMAFKEIDKDKNQKLTFEEFANSKRLLKISKKKQRGLFDFLDKNKDGELDLSELRPLPPKWVIHLEKAFARLDKDQSGTLNFDEFAYFEPIKKMNAKAKKQAIRRMDQNRDKFIDHHELKMAQIPPSHRGHKRRFEMRHFDSNQSGGLDFKEYLKMTWVRHMPELRRKELFQRIDKNGDGEISPAEIRQHRAKRNPPPPPHHPPHHQRGFAPKPH